MGGEIFRSVEWTGSSLDDLKTFPVEVRSDIGFAIYQAQVGLKHRDAKPLKGVGAGVLEVVARHDGDTYRAVYTVRFALAVYVLHAFQKKSRRGIETPKQEIDRIRRRLTVATQHYEKHYGSKET